MAERRPVQKRKATGLQNNPSCIQSIEVSGFRRVLIRFRIAPLIVVDGGGFMAATFLLAERFK